LKRRASAFLDGVKRPRGCPRFARAEDGLEIEELEERIASSLVGVNRP